MQLPVRLGERAFCWLTAACLLAVLITFAGIGSHSLWSPDEPTGAAVGRAMLDSGDWIVPRLNGEPFLEKPPLYWWVQVGIFRQLGVSDAAARVPSALFAALTLLVAYGMGRRLGSSRQAFLTVVVLGTTLLFVQNATRVTVDPALALFVALSHLGFCVLAEPRSPAEARWARLLIAAAVPLAFLTKGVVAVGLGVGPPVLYLLATRRGRAIRDLAWLAAVAVPIFAVAVLPWALALVREAGWPGLAECLVNNTVTRFARYDTHYGHTEPFWYYLGIAPVWLLPWTLALPAMLRSGVFPRRPEAPGSGPGSEARRLLLATAALGILLLSIAASKREVYLLPLLPAWSAGVGWWLGGVGAEGTERSRDRRALLAELGFTAVLCLILGGVALGIALSPRLPAALSLVRNAVPALRLDVFAAIALTAGGALLGWILLDRRRAAVSVAWVAALLILLCLVLQTAVLALMDPVKRMDELTAAITQEFPGQGPIPAYLPPVVSNESILGIINFKLGRRALPLSTPEDLRAQFEREPDRPVLLRADHLDRLPTDLLQGLHFVYDERGRKSSPFAIGVWTGDVDQAPLSASIRVPKRLRSGV